MDAQHLFAKISWISLIVILYLRPFLEIINYRKLFFLLKYRKPLGIICGLAAFLHVFFYLKGTDSLLQYFNSGIYWRADNFLGWGSFALVAIFFPLITSNKFSQKKLKRNWKKVQKFSYPAFILTAIHIALAKGEVMEVAIPVIIWLVLFFLARYIKKNRLLKRQESQAI